MLYHVEKFTAAGWVRVAANLTSYDVAANMKTTLAKRAKTDTDNYSILIEIID